MTFVSVSRNMELATYKEKALPSSGLVQAVDYDDKVGNTYYQNFLRRNTHINLALFQCLDIVLVITLTP